MENLKIDIEPRYLLITSEPYVVFTMRGYAPVLNVFEKKTGREYRIFISAKSLSDKLEKLLLGNGEKFVGLEFWIRKESDDKFSKYLLE